MSAHATHLIRNMYIYIQLSALPQFYLFAEFQRSYFLIIELLTYICPFFLCLTLQIQNRLPQVRTSSIRPKCSDQNNPHDPNKVNRSLQTWHDIHKHLTDRLLQSYLILIHNAQWQTCLVRYCRNFGFGSEWNFRGQTRFEIWFGQSGGMLFLKIYDFL